MRLVERKAHFYQSKEKVEPAKDWMNSLKDKLGLAKILTRIKRAEVGNFGDYKSVGEGVLELRIPYGPGYRIYFGIDDSGDLIILLLGGDKTSQSKDINKAKRYWRDYKNRRPL